MWTNSQQSGRRAGPALDARVPWAGSQLQDGGTQRPVVPVPCPRVPVSRVVLPGPPVSIALATQEPPPCRSPSSPRWPWHLVFFLIPLVPPSQRPYPARSLRPHSRAVRTRAAGESVPGTLPRWGSQGHKAKAAPSLPRPGSIPGLHPQLVCAGSRCLPEREAPPPTWTRDRSPQLRRRERRFVMGSI